MSSNLPVGSIIYSMLNEVQFANEMGLIGNADTWVLADGRSVDGQRTRYQAATGNSHVPDLRGIFVRGKNNGRADGFYNPDGELALGSVSPDKFRSHNHNGSTGDDTPDHSHHFGGYAYGISYGGDNQGQNLGTPENGFGRNTNGASNRHSHPIQSDGGNETAPKSISLNAYIRVN